MVNLYNPMNEPENHFTFIAGVLIRSAVKDHIEGILFNKGLTYDIRENRRLLYSSFYITYCGNQEKINIATEAIQDYIGSLLRVQEELENKEREKEALRQYNSLRNRWKRYWTKWKR